MLLPAAAPWGMNCMLPPCDMRPSCSRSCLMDCLMEMGLALSKPPRSLTARNSVTYRLQGQTGIAGVDSMVLDKLGQSPGLNKHAQCVSLQGI